MTGRGKLLKNILKTPSDSGIGTDTGIKSSLSRPITLKEIKKIDEGIHEESCSSSSSDSISKNPRQARGRFTNLLKKDLPEVTSAKSESVDENSIDVVPIQKLYYNDKGTKINVAVNYVRLKTDPNKGVFEYEVRFNPNIASKHMRYALLQQHKDTIGQVKTFDGVTLLLPMQLEKNIIKVNSNTRDGDVVELTLIFKKQKQLRDCINLYGVLFERISHILKMVRYNRKHFDPARAIPIPQHKLELWPGHIISVDELKDGLMLCMDVSFKLLNKKSVRELLLEAYNLSKEGDFRTKFEKAIIGAIVITNYNNKTYRVDEVLWDKNPMSTFDLANGQKLSFKEYYSQNWNIEIIDLKQPLLLNHNVRRVSGKDEYEETQLCLIPEICHLTGLNDTMRKDFKVMKDIASHTRVTPNQRVQALKTFVRNVKENEEAVAALDCWGLKIDDSILNIEAHKIEETFIQLKNKTIAAIDDKTFGTEVGRNEILDAVDLTQWILMYPTKQLKLAQKFTQLVQQCSKQIGMLVEHPQICELNSDIVTAYVSALRYNIKSHHRAIVIIVPSQREDRYAAIKRLCCSEIPIPSQVIHSKTLEDERKVRNVVCKILLQINCKIGGSLWGIDMPLNGTMIVGVDTYHDGKQSSKSVSGFVASTDSKYGRWFSRASIQEKKEELMNGLSYSLNLSIRHYAHINGTPPKRIIYYRDGVGDGQFEFIQNYEIPQLIKGWKNEFVGYEPEFIFIVVQKRINTRIMVSDRSNGYKNPPAGTVVDKVITRKDMYDFFLVSQNVNHGTASPTHYIVLNDTSQFSIGVIQKITYKLCYIYYNFPGAVKVPAPCLYAHKLAYLVGEYIKRNVHSTLNDKLFYL